MREIREFSSTLNRLKKVWQLGLVLRTLIRLLGWFLIFALFIGIADYCLAFSPAELTSIDGVTITFFTLLIMVWITRVAVLDSRAIANRVDELSNDSRRSILSAVELQDWLKEKKDDDDLSTFLALRAINRATEQLKAIPLFTVLPKNKLQRQSRAFFWQALFPALLIVFYAPATKTITSRFLCPYEDIPPYSVYSFAVKPQMPEVLYGSGAEISVAINGGKIDGPVKFVARSREKSYEVACFKLSDGNYGQRLEKVIAPVDFCFTYGRTRSKWHSINLILQPRVALAQIALTPPKYTNLPKRTFYLGNEPLAGLVGSRVKLIVTSNRPLLDGTLAIKREDDEQTVAGKLLNQKDIEFTWNIEKAAQLKVSIRDVRGTPNLEPLTFRQRLLIDEKPEVAITSPGMFALATAKSVVPLAGYADDDYGLKSLELVRSVMGFRDRTLAIGPLNQKRHFDFEYSLALAKLGAEAGQVFEFFLEACDHDPSLLGFSSTPVVRLQIISDDEYRALVRSKMTLEKFMARYEKAEAEVSRMQELLDKLEEAIKNGASTQKLKEIKEKLIQQLTNSAKSFSSLSQLFSVFDLDKRLSAFLDEMAKTLEKLKEEATNTPASSSALSDLLDKMKESLKGPQQSIKAAQKLAKLSAVVARLMALADAYRRIVNTQNTLVRRLNRFANIERDKSNILPRYGDTQHSVIKQLEDFSSQLVTRANALSSEFKSLRDSALEFAKKIKLLEIPSLMSKAKVAAKNGEGREAYERAKLASERLEMLMCESQAQNSPMASLMRGEMKFNVPKNIAKTLEQMMSSFGRSAAGQLASAMSGDGDGTQMSSSTPLNTPIYGPPLSSEEGSSRGIGSIANGKDGKSTGESTSVDEALEVKNRKQNSKKAITVNQIPEKYREAVKRYFSIERSPK